MWKRKKERRKKAALERAPPPRSSAQLRFFQFDFFSFFLRLSCGIKQALFSDFLPRDDDSRPRYCAMCFLQGRK